MKKFLVFILGVSGSTHSAIVADDDVDAISALQVSSKVENLGPGGSKP